MNPLDLQSERVLATGNILSEGVRNQLGRPRMDPLTLLVREAGQNSWDAKAEGEGPVRFGVDLYEVSEDQKRLLRDEVLARLPGGLVLAETLARRRATPVRLLAISDRGTVGLGGPTRADIVGSPNEPRNFVKFLRNVGQPADRIGGGTYGYGKAAFYRVSRPRTILVHTRCQHGRGVQTRFMVSALGESYIRNGVRYTGRHWWGRQAGDVVEPLTGRDADVLGAALGLPSFEGDELGTTVAVLDPQLDGRSPSAAMGHLAEATLWHFWPKMLPESTGRPAMLFRIADDGNDVPVPDPRTIPPLNGFAEAMDAVRGRSRTHSIALDTAILPIYSQRPAADLGSLALVKFGHRPRPRLTADNHDGAWIIPDLAHHVALMRGPELVVKYVEGPVLPGDAVEYGGVFVVDPSVEEAFARSEPPTHDDWSPENLEDPWEKTYVRVAQRRIAEILEDYAVPRPVIPARSSEVGLGAFSDELGAIFLGEPGTGLSVPDDTRGPSGQGGTGGTRPRRPTLTILEGAHLELLDGRRTLRVDFTIEHIPGSARSIVVAAPSVILDGHAVETDPPTGVGVPEVICWVGPDGRRYTGESVIAPVASDGPWSVFVSVPADAAVAVDLQATSGGLA